jgi:folate-binding protein YgfZ
MGMYCARISAPGLSSLPGGEKLRVYAMPDLTLTVLDDLAVVSAHGPDVLSFLNGQLSQDISLLPERRALLAGLHNPQGRVIALIRAMYLDDSHVLLVLPRELADGVRTHLHRFVFRSRVRIEDASTAWCAYGLAGPDAEAACSTRLHMALDSGGMRQFVVAPRGETLPQSQAASRDDWLSGDIAAGIPQITSATSGLWVAQMLNLDLLGGISFEKGCYTGQEVIARAHFRGQVKRRMQRFFTHSLTALVPGEKVRLQDGRSAQVVVAAQSEYDGQEFLAVAAISAASGSGPAEDPAPLDVAAITVSTLTLPYRLPV